MLKIFSSLFSGKPAKPTARVPDGVRVYAVGDIHGRLDLFEALIAAIEADDGARDAGETMVILLGDLVDRGPDSAGVLKRARRWGRDRTVHTLMGNHEEMFLKSFDDMEMLKHFLRHGGKETILSFGADRKRFTSATIEQAQAMMAEVVGEKDLAFMRAFEDRIQLGDYLFVHAGVNPNRPLDQQKKKDLRWIREPFLSHAEAYPDGIVVVHGHTIRDNPEDKGNRIGIDTGAYASGRLTALVLEGAERRYLAAVQDEDGSIGIEHT